MMNQSGKSYVDVMKAKTVKDIRRSLWGRTGERDSDQSNHSVQSNHVSVRHDAVGFPFKGHPMCRGVLNIVNLIPIVVNIL